MQVNQDILERPDVGPLPTAVILAVDSEAEHAVQVMDGSLESLTPIQRKARLVNLRRHQIAASADHTALVQPLIDVPIRAGAPAVVDLDAGTEAEARPE